MPKIDHWLLEMRDIEASDLHLTVGQPPKFRIHGEMTATQEAALTAPQLEEIGKEICSERQWQAFTDEHDLDFAHSIQGYARFRTNYLMQQHGMGIVMRMIPDRMMTFEELGLPNSVLQFVELGFGLILVTGPTGSGKTTTLASMINYVNDHYRRHILTIEEPIEFVHQHKQCLITQREVGLHTQGFSNALRSAMRMDPNVILVGEMRDPETISLALTCAEMGILVFGTLHTNSAAKTVDRIVDVFPAEEQARIRTMLASSLQGVVAQQLLRRADGKGRLAAFEILTGSPALGSLIRTGQTVKIESMIQSGGSLGMQSMDSNIGRLLQDGKITGEEAYMKAFDKRTFEDYWSFAMGNEEDVDEE
jgi:twitching motility protein PilT